MLLDEVKKLSNLDIALYWIRERLKIQKKRERGLPFPWTDDLILQTYRFCCVRRMDDRVSQWLFDNWYKPYYNHPNSLLACMVARHFNYVPSLEEIGYPDMDPYHYLDHAQEILQARKEQGKSTFNSAYIITGITEKGVKAEWDKITTVLHSTIKNVLDRRPQLNYSHMEEWVSTLAEYPRIGTFTAGQIVADLRWAVDGEWLDRNRWAPQGPGSTRGLCRIFNKTINPKGLNKKQFMELFTQFCVIARKRLGPLLSNLESMDLQNALCETDKYIRVLHDEGRPKRVFRPDGYKDD